MNFKVGDKVKFKTVEQMYSEGWKANIVGGLYKTAYSVIVTSLMRSYFGRVVTIKSIGEYYVNGSKHFAFTIEEDYGSHTWYDIFIDEAFESNFVDLQSATKSLINGECDAIRFHENVSISAWYDKTTGNFNVARVVSNSPIAIDYTYKPFFMHKDYMEEGSKWELITDELKRNEMLKCKQQIHNSVSKLSLLGGLSKEEVKTIIDIIGKPNYKLKSSKE